MYSLDKASQIYSAFAFASMKSLRLHLSCLSCVEELSMWKGMLIYPGD